MDRHKLEIYFFFIVFLGVIALSFFVIKPYLYPIALALIFSIIFRPLYVKIRKTFKHHAPLASFLTLLIVFVTVLIPIVLIGIQIFKEAQNLYFLLTSDSSQIGIFKNIGNSVNTFLTEVSSGYIKPINFSAVNFNSYIEEGLNWIFFNAGALLSSVAGITISLFLFCFGLYYFFKDGEEFKKKAILLSPLPDKYDEEIAEKVSSAINSIIKGSLLVAVVQGTLTGIGFFLFGISNPVFWGAAASLASLIPGVGTALVVGPAVIYLFFTSQVAAAIGLLTWGIFAIGLIDNFIGPKMVERGTKMHNFFVLIFALGGISFFGPIGFMLGPVVLALLFAFIDIYRLINRETH